MCRLQVITCIRRNCWVDVSQLFTLTCTEKPLKFNSNKFFSIYNYLFRFIVSLFGFQWALCKRAALAVENWKLRIESYFTFHFPFSIFHCETLFRWWRWWWFLRYPQSVYLVKSLCDLRNPVVFKPSHHFRYGTNVPLCWDFRPMVEMMGFEPMTPCLQGRCSPSWATPP